MSGELEERITKALTLKLEFEASMAIPGGGKGVEKARRKACAKAQRHERVGG